MSEERTYFYSPGNYEGMYSTNLQESVDKSVENATVEDLKAGYDDNKNLQDSFGSFENYMAYMDERQDLIDSGDLNPRWWEVTAGDQLEGAQDAIANADPDDVQAAIDAALNGTNPLDSDYDQEEYDDLLDQEGVDLGDAIGTGDTDTAIGADGTALEAFQNTEKELFEKYSDKPMHFSDEKGNEYKWNGTSYVKTHYVDTGMSAGDWLELGMTVVVSVAAGNAAGAASGLTGAAGGAVSGATGSFVSGAINGDISAEGIIKGAITGAIGGWADQLKGMDGAIMDSGVLGGMDDAVNATADLLGLPYDEALALLQGVAQGAVNGEDLDGIILGAVSGWGTSKTQDFLQGMYGDEVNVSDWFKDGQSNIPIEALDPFIEGAWNAALSGELDAGDIAKMLWDYHREGGDLDFLLPPGVDIPDGGALEWINAQLPDVTINWGSDEFDVTYEEGLGEDEGFEEEEKDKVTVDVPGIDIPDVDVDIDVPEVKCPTGERWSTDLSKCIPDIDIPEIKCPTGERWSTDLSKCIPDVELPEIPEVPDVIECMEGFEWDDILEKCVEIPEVPDAVECMEGFQWDDLLGKCIEIPEVPDAVECMEGWEWSDILEKCVEIPEAPETPEGPDVDIDIEIPEIKCPDGESWSSDLSECIPDVSLPDVPSVSGGPSPSYKHNPQGLFDYINISPQEAAQLTPYVDYVQKARGMLS